MTVTTAFANQVLVESAMSQLTGSQRFEIDLDTLSPFFRTASGVSACLRRPVRRPAEHDPG
jgi:hypothetical protein